MASNADVVETHWVRWEAYSLVAYLGHWAIDQAFLSGRSTVPTPNRDTSNIWALITFSAYVTCKRFACVSCPLPVSPSLAAIYLVV